MRTTRPSPLPDPERRPARAVRLYRGVLQHPPQAFGAGVSLPGCVREEVLHATGHDLTSYCPPNRGNSIDPSRSHSVEAPTVLGSKSLGNQRESKTIVRPWPLDHW